LSFRLKKSDRRAGAAARFFALVITIFACFLRYIGMVNGQSRVAGRMVGRRVAGWRKRSGEASHERKKKEFRKKFSKMRDIFLNLSYNK
jgi:hypothetical protein